MFLSSHKDEMMWAKDYNFPRSSQIYWLADKVNLQVCNRMLISALYLFSDRFADILWCCWYSTVPCGRLSAGGGGLDAAL